MTSTVALAYQHPKWLDRTEYPFTAHFFESTGVKQHYVDTGSGPVILLVHGTPSWSYDFRHLIKDLSKDFRCIAPDHIGFGLSDKPKDYDYSTQNHSQRLEALIEHLQLDSFILVAHDFGGPIAVRYAEAHPQKVSRIIMMNTWLWSFDQDPNYEKANKILSSPMIPFLYLSCNFSVRVIAPKAFGEQKASRQFKKHLRKPLGKRSKRFGTLAFVNSLLNDGDWFNSLWNNRKSIDHIPILLVWGMKDPAITPFSLHKLEEGFANTQTIQLDSAGHFPQEESPQVVINAIRTFLGSSV